MLPLVTDSFEKVLAAARQCEQLGYDSVWAFDHLAPYWTRSGGTRECWTVLAALAEHTHGIKIGSMVTNVILRHPAVLGKMAATVDVVSGGRLILGLGTGDRLSRTELTSYGYPFGGLTERAERLRETVQILKAAWTHKDATFKGRFYQVSHAQCYPKPIQQPHPPIWIGGKHNEILNVIAESADGWNYWNLRKEQVEAKRSYLRDRCVALRRPFDDITKSWSGVLPDSSEKDNVLEFLRNEVHEETRYLIASLGTHPKPGHYEAFAEAASEF